MYFTKSVDGLPEIQYQGRRVLSVWDQDWDFAYELCDLLNAQENRQPERLLTESDRKWLKAIDHAFEAKVQHA